jgi:uncharacterized protein (TIGR02246 family)
MFLRWSVMTFVVGSLFSIVATIHAADANEDAAKEPVRKTAEKLSAAFNAGKVDDMIAVFLPNGELIDEEGTIYQGRQEIRGLLNAYFQRFPGSKLTRNVDSIRMVGPVAIEEGNRTIATKDDKLKSQFRYIAVWVKNDRDWQLASFRDFADDPAPTPHEYLQPLSWLVGDWINEGADGKVAISYRWSADKNFLLGDFDFNAAGDTPRKSTQRIGWDPSVGRIRSWLFDADGGFAEGQWTMVDKDIVIKSSSVNPDGGTASATMTVTPDGKDRFTITGTDRIVGDGREDDFEITVVRRPPTASRK